MLTRAPAGIGDTPVLEAPLSCVPRQQAARMLRVSERQVAAWQRAGLVSQTDSLSLRDLATLRTLHRLRQQKLSLRSIRRSMSAMRVVIGPDGPAGSDPVSCGSRLMFRHGGALLDPLTQQLRFDFEAGPCQQIQLVRSQSSREHLQHGRSRAQEAFQQAVRLEDQPGATAAAEDLYRQALSLCPRHAPACINLGTILYNTSRFAEAEEYYRAAAEIDPDYALAFFDLGNVLDELRRLSEAITAYQRAVQLVPQYADAHYNLALAYERSGERRRALRHWMHYVRLDPVGPWATHARMQVRRTLASERLSIVARGSKLA